MFIATLPTKIQVWNQSTYPSTDALERKIWYRYKYRQRIKLITLLAKRTKKKRWNWRAS